MQEADLPRRAALCQLSYFGSGNPSTRFDTTFRFTSDVPPSMELAFERSQPGVTHGLNHQFRAPLSQDGGAGAVVDAPTRQ